MSSGLLQSTKREKSNNSPIEDGRREKSFLLDVPGFTSDRRDDSGEGVTILIFKCYVENAVDYFL